MKVSGAMSRDVRVASPGQTIQDAAKMMSDIGSGVLPVGENDRLVGMITDRDIAVRAVAQGKGPHTLVREVMTDHVHYCFDDEDIDEVTSKMADSQVRRLPVVNRDKRLVGILSLGDVAKGRDTADEAGAALSDISRPGGAHSQRGRPKSALADRVQGRMRDAAEGASELWDEAYEGGRRYYRQGSQALAHVDNVTMSGWLIAGAIGFGLAWLIFGHRSVDDVAERMSESSYRPRHR
jgi:CBS domain-containing protein